MKFKRIIIACIVMILALGSFAGCNGASDVDDTEGTLNIFLLEAGFGIDFMTDWIAEYKKLEGKADAKVNFVYDVEASSKAANYLANPAENPYDLFLTGGVGFKNQASINNLADISDVYANLAHPIDPDFAEIGKLNDKYYMMPWASGACGLVYNTDFLPEDKVPNTTNELVKLCADINAGNIATAKNKKPFVWAGKNAGNYWAFLYDAWWAQYEGRAEYSNFWSLNNSDPEGYIVYQQEGILKSLTVLQSLLIKDNCVHGSDTKEHTPAQANFMNGDSVMIPVGDWLQNEMKTAYSDVKNYKLMRTPVISDLGAKLKLAGSNATLDEHDAKLSQVITLIDDGNDADKIVSIAGITKPQALQLIDARNLVVNIGPNHQAYIPSKSNAINEAKDFMKFMSSDKAIEIFRNRAGSDLPFVYEIPAGERTPYVISKDEIMANTRNLFPNPDSSSIRYKAGLEKWNKITDIEKQLYNNSTTPQKIFDANYGFLFGVENRWDYYYSRR